MLTNSDIMQLIAKGESQSAEFKLSMAPDVIETLCAFANTNGGSVLLGVSDNGAVKGVVCGKETVQQWINQIKNTTMPSIVPDTEEVDFDGKTVVAFTVQEYPIKPVACKGRYYKRAKNANVQMSVTEVVNSHLKACNTSWDCYPDQQHQLDSISLEKVARFVARANQERENPIIDPPLGVLYKYELFRDDRITYAAFLLFMECESSLSTIELGRFQTETIIKDGARFKTDLFAEVDGVLAFIKKHINKNIVITGDPQHHEVWEYPIEALREIIINAIIHRDYSLSSDTVIKVFDDRIEFYNPGKLPVGLSVEKLVSGEYVSTPRNKKIAEIFKEAGLIEKYGAGIRRIFRAFNEMGARRPEIVEIGEGFRITVFATPQATPPITPPIGDDTTSRKNLSERILQLITLEPNLLSSDIAQRFDLKRDTVKEYLEKLKRENFIRWIGNTRKGHWEILK